MSRNPVPTNTQTIRRLTADTERGSVVWTYNRIEMRYRTVRAGRWTGVFISHPWFHQLNIAVHAQDPEYQRLRLVAWKFLPTPRSRALRDLEKAIVRQTQIPARGGSAL